MLHGKLTSNSVNVSNGSHPKTYNTRTWKEREKGSEIRIHLLGMISHEILMPKGSIYGLGNLQINSNLNN